MALLGCEKPLNINNVGAREKLGSVRKVLAVKACVSMPITHIKSLMWHCNFSVDETETGGSLGPAVQPVQLNW